MKLHMRSSHYLKLDKSQSTSLPGDVKHRERYLESNSLQKQAKYLKKSLKTVCNRLDN